MIGADIVRRYRLTRRLFELRKRRDELVDLYNQFLMRKSEFSPRHRRLIRKKFLTDAKELAALLRFVERELSEAEVAT